MRKQVELSPTSVLGISLCSLSLLALSGCPNPTPPASPSSSPTPSPTPPPAPTAHLAVWSNTWDGIAITMVGTDPSIPKAGTTTINTTIIPVNLNFPGGVLSPEETSCGDHTSVINRVSQSPVFTNNNWTAGNVSLGTTQFGDAFQRGNFWYYVSRVSPNYHIVLNPTVSSPININVPPQYGTVQSNSFCPSQPYGVVSYDYINAAIQAEIANLHITADTLPIFITYNTSFPLSNGGVFLGFHSLVGSQTYVVASYMDSAFSGLSGYGGVTDIAILTHEIGEWIDNPLAVNFVPPWGNIGIQTSCGNTLEVGDPLTGHVYPFISQTTGFTYHIQELGFISWFMRDIPSGAVNGLYSTNGYFQSPATPCM